jgi:hypothetical protein
MPLHRWKRNLPLAAKHKYLITVRYKLPGILIIFLVALIGGYYLWQYGIEAAATIGSDNPSFQADLKNTLDLQAGAGKATFTRATTATVTDFEGLIKTVKSGEARFEGARRVENLNPKSEADSGWVAGGTTPPTVSTSVVYNGKTAVSATLPAGVSGYAASRATGSSFPIVLGHTYTTRFSISADRALTGTETITVYITGSNGAAPVTFSTTKNLTSSWTTYSASATIGVFGGSDYFTLLPATTLSSPITIYLTERQVEDVTGQTNQNPSEYVSTNVKTSAPYHGANVDGVKYFATYNGNTVASNVVTEATGVAIPDATLHGYVAEGARTNLATYSEEIGDAHWLSSNLTRVADSAVSPAGTMTADSVTGDYLYQSKTVAASAVYTFSYYAKLGTATQNQYAIYDETNSAFIIAQTVATGVNASTWTRVTVTFTTPAGCTTARIYPMRVDTGTVYLWGAQLEAGAFASSYIPTVASAVARNADVLTYPTAGNFSGTLGSAYAEVATEWGGASDTYAGSNAVRFLSQYNFGKFDFVVYTNKVGLNDGTAWRLGNVFAGGNTIQKIAIKWGGTSTKTFLNGIASSAFGFDGDMNMGIRMGVGSTAIEVANTQLYGTIRNVKIWKKALTDAQLANLTSTDSAVSQSAVKKATVKQGNATTTINASQNTKLTDGLVGLWSFNGPDVTDKIYDRSGQGNNGYFIGGATSSAKTIGRVGQALSFNGTNQYINNIGGLSSYSFIQNTAVFSISSWIKLDNNTARQMIVSSTAATAEKGFFFAYETLGGAFGTKAIRFGIDKGVGGVPAVDAKTNDNIITDTLWHHVAVTGIGNSISFYVDGVQQSTTYITSFSALSSGDSSRNLTIAVANLATPALFFAGKIDEVRIYNRTLSDSEALQLYNLGR